MLFYGFLVLNGAFLGIGTAGFFAMIADTIEYGEWKTKKRIEGLTYSAASVGTKIGGGVGAALVGWLLALVHYNGTLATQPEAVSSMIVWINLWIPGMICLIVAIVLSFNKVDKLYPQIMRDLDARKGVKEV